MKIKITMIDPPSGWKWGFPKPVPSTLDPFLRDTPPTDDEFREWFRSEGVPESDIEFATKHSRMWQTEIDINNG
jgi:hypothetical protein